jgi:hypothetical protein
MWEPRRLTTLWASTISYRYSEGYKNVQIIDLIILGYVMRHYLLFSKMKCNNLIPNRIFALGIIVFFFLSRQTRRRNSE